MIGATRLHVFFKLLTHPLNQPSYSSQPTLYQQLYRWYETWFLNSSQVEEMKIPATLEIMYQASEPTLPLSTSYLYPCLQPMPTPALLPFRTTLFHLQMKIPATLEIMYQASEHTLPLSASYRPIRLMLYSTLSPTHVYLLSTSHLPLLCSPSALPHLYPYPYLLSPPALLCSALFCAAPIPYSPISTPYRCSMSLLLLPNLALVP